MKAAKSVSSLTILLAMTLIVNFSFALEDIHINESDDITVTEPLKGKNINIKTDQNLTTEKKLDAQKDIKMESGSNTNIKGTIQAGGKVNIRAGGGIKINGAIKSGGDVFISSGGNLEINETISAQKVDAISKKNMDVNADIIGQKGVNLTTEGKGQLNVSPSSHLVSPDGKVKLRSKNLKMQGTIKDKDTK